MAGNPWDSIRFESNQPVVTLFTASLLVSLMLCVLSLLCAVLYTVQNKYKYKDSKYSMYEYEYGFYIVAARPEGYCT
jgi:hypothetical protein